MCLTVRQRDSRCSFNGCHRADPVCEVVTTFPAKAGAVNSGDLGGAWAAIAVLAIMVAAGFSATWWKLRKANRALEELRGRAEKRGAGEGSTVGFEMAEVA